MAAALLPASDGAEGPFLKTRRPTRPAKRMPQRDFSEGEGGNARDAGLEQNREFSSGMMAIERSPSSQRSNVCRSAARPATPRATAERELPVGYTDLMA